MVWPSDDTKFQVVGKDAVRGALNLPRDCGVKENQRGEGCKQNRTAFNFFSLFFTSAMVEMVVSETQKHVDRLAGLREPPSSFLMTRAGNKQWPPQSIQYFKANKFSKAFFFISYCAHLYCTQVPSEKH